MGRAPGPRPRNRGHARPLSVSDPRSHRQVHRVHRHLRRHLRQYEYPRHPDTHPNARRERLRRPLRPHHPRRMPRLTADPQRAPPAPRPPRRSQSRVPATRNLTRIGEKKPFRRTEGDRLYPRLRIRRADREAWIEGHAVRDHSLEHAQAAAAFDQHVALLIRSERQATASSASSCAIRRRAATNLAWSLLVTPGDQPGI